VKKMNKMKTLKISMIVVVILGAVSLAGYLLLGYYVKRSLKRVDFGTLNELLKAGASEVLVIPAYDEPDFTKDAKIFDSFMNAYEVANAAAKLGPNAAFPETSETLSGVERGKKLDAWGKPFYLVKFENRIAVISGGSQAVDLSESRALLVRVTGIDRLKPGPLYRFPSDMPVLIVKTGSDQRAPCRKSETAA
jgi:hypothetical protein